MSAARNQPRQPKGVPTGGQWRATGRPEGRALSTHDHRALGSVRKALHSDEALGVLDSHPATRGCDYGQGGCKVAALALSQLLPGSQVRAIKLTGSDQPQHFVVRYEGVYLDRDGAQSERQLLATAARDWLLAQDQLRVAQVTPEEVERAEAPDPLDAETGQRLSQRLAVLLAAKIADRGA